MSGYFSKFPSIVYGNALSTNITVRMKMDVLIRNKNKVFHDYVLKEGERPDTIAHHYYGDPYFAWLVYYANEIVDPYFEWPLSQRDFNAFIVKKYGSVVAAQEKVLFYRVNWMTDENMIAPGAYNSLPGNLKRYWSPVIGYQQNIISYQRAELDWVLDTNKVVSLTVASSDVNNFSIEQKVTQSGGTTSGIVRSIADNNIIVNNVEGEFLDTVPLFYDLTHSVNVESVVTLNQPISNDEIPYWTAVTAYEYEDELNESRKQIRLIDKIYLNQIELEMKALLT